MNNIFRGDWILTAKHPNLWKGWKELIHYYNISKDEAVKKAESDHRCYLGVTKYKIKKG